ncbi:transcriptional regulator [Arachidicoccus ginsenosidimutans]|uniref:BlaI/MecI/CopY family transcriptional regulator n=1 Tax=Arachidicoccus sp. BS20 TaxID=1850526 RepID=UPI0007F05D80|nr:BlaI/MecI/CopY family transcriptional regulator [Arachidicoccus sp. BS20]ANI87867.1 transcriptional regulator [Arachidicoccus sp. BS20]
MAKQIKLTESESEILQILWELGPASVREVHEALNKIKDTGYTTTLKLMQIMHEKNLLTRDDKARVHIYKPAISLKAGQQQAVTKIIKTMFKGSPAQLVMHALGNHRPSKEELDEIKKYLKELEKNS